MNNQHLKSITMDYVAGRGRIVFEFTGISAHAYFTQGESVTVTLLKLEKLRAELQQQARILGRPPGGLKI